MTMKWQVVHQVLSSQADIGRVVPRSGDGSNNITLTPSVNLIENMSVIAYANYDDLTTVANIDGHVCLSTADTDTATRPYRGSIAVKVASEITDENFSNNAMDYAYEWDMKFCNMDNIGNPQYILAGLDFFSPNDGYAYYFLNGTTNRIRLYKRWRNGKLCATVHTYNHGHGVTLDIDYDKWHKCRLVPAKIFVNYTGLVEVDLAFSIDGVFVSTEYMIGRHRDMNGSSFALNAVGLMSWYEESVLNPFVIFSNFKVLYKKESE